MWCAAERFLRIACPCSNRRSDRLACARTLPSYPTTDGMRFLDPLAGPSKLDLAAGGGVVRLSASSPIATLAALSAMRALRIGRAARGGGWQLALWGSRGASG